MSRTYKKYPLVRELANGVFYDNWKDIPKKKTFRTYYSPETETKLVREYYTKICERTEQRFDYFKMVEKEVQTGEYVKHIHEYETYGDSESCYYYNKKSREGWSPCRLWRSGSVGKANKRIRAQKHRSEARDVIAHWKKGDFSRDIERERNHDRWDRW